MSADIEAGIWRGIGWFGPDKLRAYEGGNMLRLGRYDDARVILDDALAGLDDTMQRHRATALCDRAEAHLGAGDIDACATDAAAALELVTRVEHSGNLERVMIVADKIADSGERAAKALRLDVQLARTDHSMRFR
jgi:hypothetical protein